MIFAFKVYNSYSNLCKDPALQNRKESYQMYRGEPRTKQLLI